MNKTVFAYDYSTVDAEIERLKPQIAAGGFIPCPDHRNPHRMQNGKMFNTIVRECEKYSNIQKNATEIILSFVAFFNSLTFVFFYIINFYFIAFPWF